MLRRQMANTLQMLQRVNEPTPPPVPQLTFDKYSALFDDISEALIRLRPKLVRGWVCASG